MDAIIKPRALTGKIEAPASKSFAHRAFICAALAKGKSEIILRNSCGDIDATVSCLINLGAKIKKNGPIYTVYPIESPPESVVLNCAESASTLRFLLPAVCALGINAEFEASETLKRRPAAPLLDELRRNGAAISEGFPIRTRGGLSSGEFVLRGDVGSQFATGALIALTVVGGSLRILPPVFSRPYIDVSLDVLRSFGAKIFEENGVFRVEAGALAGRRYEIEGDWSGAAFFLCAGAEITGLNPDSLQGDAAVLDVLKKMGARVFRAGDSFRTDLSSLEGREIDASDCPDLVPALAAAAATAKGKTVIYNAARLRFKESDRLFATARALNALGADIRETADGLAIKGKAALAGGETGSFSDHRIVMAAAVAASGSLGETVIRGAEAVCKSYPRFFEDFNELGGSAYVVRFRE